MGRPMNWYIHILFFFFLRWGLCSPGCPSTCELIFTSQALGLQADSCYHVCTAAPSHLCNGVCGDLGLEWSHKSTYGWTVPLSRALWDLGTESEFVGSWGACRLWFLSWLLEDRLGCETLLIVNIVYMVRSAFLICHWEVIASLSIYPDVCECHSRARQLWASSLGSSGSLLSRPHGIHVKRPFHDGPLVVGWRRDSSIHD